MTVSNKAARHPVHHEVERKFDVDPTLRMPDLRETPGVREVGPPEEHLLKATYFDTADLRLATRSVTLRRRTGGTDAGWHLKVPTADGNRDEIRQPVGRAVRTVPRPLLEELHVFLRGAQPEPVAQLTTRRVVRRLLGADDAVLAEVSDDVVTATAPGGTLAAARPGAAGTAAPAGGDPAAITTWREIEVELVDGDAALLDAVAERLSAAGATPSRHGSKLARALGERMPAPAAQLPDGVPADSAGATVLDYLRTHVEQLQSWDPAVRADAYDAVHKMRVAARRLRSALATYRPLFDRTRSDPIRAELKWLGTLLGAARDAEVVRDHLLAMVRAEPEELVLGPVVQRIDTTLDRRYREAHDNALAELVGERYFRLLDTLDALLGHPPFEELAYEPADDVVRRRVAKAWRRTSRLARAVADAEIAEQHDRALHEVRKAAKRARYAGESAVPAFGSAAAKFAARLEAVQEVLGAHQDSVVIRADLRQLGVQAHLAGENGFTFGRLHALEQARGERTERDYEAVWRRAARAKWRAWL